MSDTALRVSAIVAALLIPLGSGCAAPAGEEDAGTPAEEATPQAEQGEAASGDEPAAAAAPTTRVELLERLAASGLDAEVADPVRQPFLSPPGEIVRVEGGALSGATDLQTFEYEDEEAAAAEAATIGPDGNPENTMIGWIAPPHYFRAGRLVVLYVGDDAEMIEVLRDLLGPPFAGGEEAT